VYFKHGAYYFEHPTSRQWIHLGRTRASAMQALGCLNAAEWPEDSGRVIATLMRGARSRSRAYGVECSITANDVRDLLQRAGGRCEVTGIRFSWQKVPGASRRPYVPSLDRIDAAEGYTPANTRIVICAANYAMSDWGEQVLLRMAQHIRRLKKSAPRSAPSSA
jgi:hypothetical protein